MGRKHTFMDREFGRPDYGSSDEGDFEKGLVFVIMPFTGVDMDEAYKAVKDECRKLRLRTSRVDESAGSGLVIAKSLA